jgi:hypothetical protein
MPAKYLFKSLNILNMKSIALQTDEGTEILACQSIITLKRNDSETTYPAFCLVVGKKTITLTHVEASKLRDFLNEMLPIQHKDEIQF